MDETTRKMFLAVFARILIWQKRKQESLTWQIKLINPVEEQCIRIVPVTSASCLQITPELGQQLPRFQGRAAHLLEGESAREERLWIKRA